MPRPSDEYKLQYTSEVRHADGNTMMGLRFRGLVFTVEKVNGVEVLTILVPASDIPEGLRKALHDTGLRTSQQQEVCEQIETMTCFNHMQENIDRR